MPKVEINVPPGLLMAVDRLRPRRDLQSWLTDLIEANPPEIPDDDTPPNTRDLRKDFTAADHAAYNAEIRGTLPANPLADVFDLAAADAAAGLQGQAATQAVLDNPALQHVYRAAVLHEATRNLA